jgi:hypothetical protein
MLFSTHTPNHHQRPLLISAANCWSVSNSVALLAILMNSSDIDPRSTTLDSICQTGVGPVKKRRTQLGKQEGNAVSLLPLLASKSQGGIVLILEVITIFLVAIAMSTAVAHALEFPGKLRLDHKSYVTVQTIYYPGFTVAGVGEPLAAVAALILLLIFPDRGTAFWWVLSAFIALLLMHAVFWFVTQPTNRYWLRSQKLGRVGAKFFAVDRTGQSGTGIADNNMEWQHFRDRWEYSHIVRAILSVIALIALTIAIAR